MGGPGSATTRGWFITIDGPDGGGKTTQAERLEAQLRTRRAGRPARPASLAAPGSASGSATSCSPGPTQAGAAPDPLTDALLFNAARRQLVEERIRPVLTDGTTVVCARFADSTLAYQGYGAGVPLATLRALADAATDGLSPDLTILLDLPVDVGLARKAPSDVTRFEAEFDIAFHERVRAGFLAIAAAEPARVVVIDATAPEDDVASRIVRAVHARLAHGEPEPAIVRITR